MLSTILSCLMIAGLSVTMASFSTIKELWNRRARDVEGQLEVLQKLHDTAQSADGVLKTLSQQQAEGDDGCLSTVVELLGSSSPAVQEKAARVMGCFAQAGPAYQRMIACSRGALARLAALEAHKASAGTLGALDNSSATDQERIGNEPGECKGLAALLSSRVVGAQTAGDSVPTCSQSQPGPTASGWCCRQCVRNVTTAWCRPSTTDRILSCCYRGYHWMIVRCMSRAFWYVMHCL
jgi:hypothetical protein